MFGQVGVRVAILLLLSFTMTASHGRETLVMLPQLPEGDGLAAKYPGDVGIEEDPAVVFADDFEGFEDDTIATDGTPQKGMKWDTAWHMLRITQDPENVHSGSQAVEMRHDVPMSYGMDKELKGGFDTLHVRYYMKLHPEFPGCHHTGMNMWAGSPDSVLGSGTEKSVTGVPPNGENHFVARLDTSRPRRGTSDRAPGRSSIYCYHMDQGRRWGDIFFPSGEVHPRESKAILGEDYVPRPDFIAELDRWYCYELMIAANTPGERDGRVAIWVDGKLTGEVKNLRFRTVDRLKLNHVVLNSYSSRQHDNKVLWYDDVVVATSYIGPQAPTDPEPAED